MRLWTGAALASYVTVLSAGLLSFLIFSLLSTNQQLTHRADTYKDSYDHIPSSRADPRTKYSGLPLSEGQLFHLDTHFVRRRGRRSVDISTSDRLSRRGLRGVARDCGSACHLRLRSKDTVYVVHLHRWHQIAAPHNKSLPVVPNSAVAPLVVYIDDESHVHARISRTSNDCIYRARVVPSKEHSIVNLCDSETGLYGLLALPDGVYTVEPLMEESNEDAANGTATARKARSRRSANSWDHYAEVLVVADQKMLEYHGHHLEDYILTLFSTVASIYRHQSLRASINIVVVKIVILKHENAGLKVKPNAQEALKDFCRWQQLYNDFNDESPHHHDVAILLTRVDICRARDKCDTLGLAELGTMCDRQKSCAIIEDNGLSAAFTIAHEMGHIFNIPHDDERKCGQYMQLNKANFHIMAPTLEYNTHPWSWSPCSAALLDRFLDQHRGQIQCLFDQPVERRYYEDMFSHQAPGRKYDVNQQCKFVFGPMAELCPYMPACRRLWCATYYGSQVGCRTQHMPWADGTPCDDTGHQFCHHGQCVGMAPEQRSKQDGAWGDWQPYGVCSRTCGGGIQKSVRDCNSPRPANGGKYCVGQKERYRSCNTQECDWDTPGFREVQCSEYNNRNVGIHGINVSTTVWVPKYAGVATNERCKLYCRVVDGTACDRNGDDVCIDGTCMPAGCDHVLYSQMKRDKCGICGGDESSCKVVKGTFNERGTFGYNEVMKIPAGSANIDIRQHGYKNQKEDDNYLSLRSADGEFLLNGHYQVSVFKQQIPIQDVVLEYSGSENVIERINGTGPIRSDIYVHVLSVGNLYPPDIRYEYMTAVPGAVIRPPVNPDTELVHYYWRRGDRWSACDRICQGKQTQEIICMDATHGRPASERNCRARKPEAHTRMCNIECSTRWIVEDLSACSAACGAGQKRQRVSCAKTEQGRQTSVADSDCDSAVKPPSITHCYVDCSGRRWSYSEWSTCTETCGEKGVQRRKAFCVDGNNRAIDESHCGKEYKEQTERDCNRVPCPRWLYGPWSECSRSCGGGIRMRHAQCLDAAEREVHEAACGQKVRMKNDIAKNSSINLAGSGDLQRANVHKLVIRRVVGMLCFLRRRKTDQGCDLYRRRGKDFG
ncbi:hypothetical protein WR25_23439 isoform B [Diploscapter pachys]|uniref:Peptidase M12B domain-containing protein n=1 Tax=Diploscapter pachys TaxID=2018661 RepID=A0A2A2KQH1_9BILA|nr:hypothetical protein WR25_23439 isoform B [Diploscapter pachys]